MAERFEYYNTGDDGHEAIYGVNWQGQTFTPSTAHKITYVRLLLWRYGSPGTITVSIRATNGEGKPTGGDLCSGWTYAITLPTSSPGEWRAITLGDGYDLDADTKYAIVVRAPDGDVDNELRWRRDASSPTYAGGTGVSSSDSGSTWSVLTTLDFMFEDWGEPLGVPYEKTLTESLGLVDKVVKTPSVVKTEPLGLLDTYSRTWAAYRVLPEILGLSDTVVKAPALVKTESLGLADTVVKMASIVKSEALGLVDTYSRVWDAYRTYTELLGLIDTYDRVWSAYRTYSELLGLLDTVTKSASIIKIESLDLEDRVSKHPSKALTEVLGLLDSVSYSKNPTILAKLIRKLIQLESIGGGGQN